LETEGKSENPIESFLEAYRALCKQYSVEIRGVPAITPEGRIIVQLVPVATRTTD
jgi:hypothetical protein